MVADEQIAEEFVAKLGNVELGQVFTGLAEALKLAGELGLLLRIETLIARPARRLETGSLFAPTEERIRLKFIDSLPRKDVGARAVVSSSMMQRKASGYSRRRN